ncbi:hypothetical protein C0992_006448 [Termitomyces sp. T32_za158]|nr:hypothetical protein C0992_006448 [Termitomyces sp. T32_za158]
MSSDAPTSPEPTVEAAAAAIESTKKARAPRKSGTAKKVSAAKTKAAPKAKTTTKTAAKVTKSKAAPSTSHPSWKDIVRECITNNKEDARQGVSRATIKKYAEEKYRLESTAANIYQLNRAITTGAETGIFSLPKGPSGKVKLAQKAKPASGAKENSKPPSKSAAKPASKTAATKKPATKPATKPAAKPAAKPATKPSTKHATKPSTKPATKPTAVKKVTPVKKTLAGKAKTAQAKKPTTKRGATKKAVTGSTPAAKAKAAAKKGVSKKVKAGTKATAAKAAVKPRSKTTSAKPGSRARKFPPPGIVLHPDDANSKVFLAIARSFLSVDNRAMTIKDLAEMTVIFGLVCQNVSAASQAITTYIRTHLQRCEAQQDQPLLLRHILSGTKYDDDLLPALHSRSGGAHCAATPDNRVTNFRRGTVVWYLSRSTGAPCPFARAGIRLCDYGEDGKKGSTSAANDKKKRERERPERCGEKRKRPLRGCVAKNVDSDNDDGQPPEKVKILLRLKPLACRTDSASTSTTLPRVHPTRIFDLSKDSDDSDSLSSCGDSMSVDSSSDDEHSPSQPAQEENWSLPPYPRKSISIPCYTPSFDEPCPRIPSPLTYTNSYRRSPSVPYSVGSPPPDSEDEDDDFHITMTGVRRHSIAPRSATADTEGWDADLDSEGDADTWESPGPRSPSAPPMPPEVTVKEEATDVQGMLEAWDDFDHSLAGSKVTEVVAHAAPGELEPESTSRVKLESMESWQANYTASHQDWIFDGDADQTARIKQEELDFDNPFCDAFGSSLPLSPLSQLPSSSYSDSPSPESSRDTPETNEKHFLTIRPRAKTQPAPFSYFHDSPSSSSHVPSSPSWGPSKPELAIAPPPLSACQSLVALIQSMSMNSPTAVAPSSLLIPASCPSETYGNSAPDVVVMMLGPFQLLRRIDTDFVNLSTIVAYSGGSWPVLSTIPNAAVVTKGSVMVSGTWVPLSAAQAYVRDHHPRQNGPLHTFLSDTLYERFPPALQDFHRSSTQNRRLGHFGPHFSSTIQATQLCGSAPEASPQPIGTLEKAREEPSFVLAPGAAFSLSLSLTSPERSIEPTAELPLSPCEQEMFQVLCGAPEWDKENSPPSSPAVGDKKTAFVTEIQMTEIQPLPSAAKVTEVERTEKPLRRSKRVADAIAAQAQNTRTRSRRGGSRNSMF